MGQPAYTDRQARGPSYALWHDLPEDVRYDANVGNWFFDDFMMGGGPSGTITTAISLPMGSGWQAFGGDGSVTITNAGEVGGAIKLLTTTDDKACCIQAHTGGFQISRSHAKLWFEMRVKFTTIVTAKQGWFAGLCEAITPSNTVPLTATSALSDNNLVGHHKPEANTTAWDNSYNIDDPSIVEVNSNVGTLVAGTYFRLGMKFEPNDGDPTNADTYNFSFYIDGVKQASVVSVIEAAGTDFPNDVVMYPTLAIQAAHADTNSCTIDWCQCAQLNV